MNLTYFLDLYFNKKNHFYIFMFKDIWIFVLKEKTFEKAVFICLHNDFAVILKGRKQCV